LILIGAFLSFVEFVFTKKTSVMNFVLSKKNGL